MLNIRNRNQDRVIFGDGLYYQICQNHYEVIVDDISHFSICTRWWVDGCQLLIAIWSLHEKSEVVQFHPKVKLIFTLIWNIEQDMISTLTFFSARVHLYQYLQRLPSHIWNYTIKIIGDLVITLHTVSSHLTDLRTFSLTDSRTFCAKIMSNLGNKTSREKNVHKEYNHKDVKPTAYAYEIGHHQQHLPHLSCFA